MMPEIVVGDARALPLEGGSVDLVITSPPYFGLRDYGTPGQLGTEPTPAEFITALIGCTREMVRALKPSGSIFINMGDKYNQSKSLSLIPERYRIAAVDELGLIARSVIVWHKLNAPPDRGSDRVRRTHEDWVHLTQSGSYFSSVDGIREPYAETSASRFGYTMSKAMRSRTEAGAALGFGCDPRGDLNKPNALGKVPGSVWPSAVEPLRGVPSHLARHPAPFPMVWPRRIIRGWCPEGGTVLDPFGGAGTTALVAAMLGRRGISVDLNPDYKRLAEWRARDPKQRAKAAGP